LMPGTNTRLGLIDPQDTILVKSPGVSDGT
jgi:hypothetical protein